MMSKNLPGQEINQTSSYHEIHSDKYVRLHYENDFFAASDYYYTQGISLELVSPFLKSNPLNYLLIKPAGYKLKYGLAIEHNGFTPLSINHPEIILGDRPFAACLFLKSYIIANNPETKTRLVSSFSTGLIGHIANGDCMQIYIHKNTQNAVPLGWENQVKNDLILNYEIQFDKPIASWKKYVLVNGYGDVKIGTLKDMVGAGFVFMAGKLHGYLLDQSKETPGNLKRRFQLYVYWQCLAEGIAYNATLQGGLLNKESPYVLKGNEINRLVIKNSIGLVLIYGRCQMEFFHTFLTKEFRSGLAHQGGGLRLGVAF